MARRVSRKAHARCRAGENPEIISKGYLSLFVDWTFNNSLDYVIGQGGGAASQHTYCTDISWEEAQPGDLAFYPDDSHVGIVVGRDDKGGILVAHCSSGHNNVVVTDCADSGFTAIGRPYIFD